MADLQERQAPIPACSSTVRLQFDGRNLLLVTTTGSKGYPAASGVRGPDFSLEAQRDQGRGTIPEGTYWIDPAQLWTRSPLQNWLTDHTSVGARLWEGWGHHRLTIHEMPATQTYGRGGFFLHGGTHPGSAGCIHLTGDGMETFLDDLRAAVGGLPACSIQLAVKY